MNTDDHIRIRRQQLALLCVDNRIQLEQDFEALKTQMAKDTAVLQRTGKIAGVLVGGLALAMILRQITPFMRLGGLASANSEQRLQWLRTAGVFALKMVLNFR